jgi:prepilin-type N-terminal cleavage/methylation domain-containing protein
MLFKWNFKSKRYKISTNQGFTLVEVMAAIIISLSVFWGIMNLYVDIVKNQVKDQTMADIRFNLSSAMDMISRDVRNADSISISTTTYSKKIDLYNFDRNGNIQELHSYSAKNDLGILYNDEPIIIPGRHLFNNEGPYEITIEDFDCKLALNVYNTSKRNLRDNFFDLTVEFKVKSNSDNDYEKIFKFEKQIFALKQFSLTKSDDNDDESQDI